MASFERSVVVNGPLADVFDFAIEPDNLHMFMPDITKIEKEYETIEEGAHYMQTREFKPGKSHTCKITFAKYDSPNHCRVEAYQKGLTCSYDFTFTAVDEGTKIDYLAEANGKWFWKIMIGMVNRMVEKADGDYIAKVKENYEQHNSANSIDS